MTSAVWPLIKQRLLSVCNITLSSRDIESRSGQAYGELKSPSDLSGPAFCWYRFLAAPGQRLELQVYRIKRLGRWDNALKRCIGGGMQVVAGGDDLRFKDEQFEICGENERYFPPLVLFQVRTRLNEMRISNFI